ncbi:MAG: 1,4-dihydroxy-2-naphthoate octaprenyltransferase [Bacteroidales bacterium]|nr:1,4-dihydroxy-2-naphthoate octaprenyltransferase [Bacteroidales bacterium]
MRLRTLPLSLAGVVCGGLLAIGEHGGGWWTFALVLITACLLQVLSNLSNEMGDHLSGVDGEGREGPNYSMADGGLTVKQMWRAINGTVVACCASGLAMVLVSGCPWWVLLLGAAAIWAATHYTLGRKPYGYRGLGDVFVFIFFGLASVLGSYYVIVHTLLPLPIWLIAPAVGIGLLSVAVLNLNNIRDMQSDEGLRKTIPLRIGIRRAKWYQTILVTVGYTLIVGASGTWWLLLTIELFIEQVYGIWRREGKNLDPLLPRMVISTFLLALLYAIAVNSQIIIE